MAAVEPTQQNGANYNVTIYIQVTNCVWTPVSVINVIRKSKAKSLKEPVIRFALCYISQDL